MASAEAPAPPEDPEMRKIIDKLALFVAKNGPEFEAMTKAKQEGNPRFAFLHTGGPYYNYYQLRLATEQTILRTKGSSGTAPAPSAGAETAAQLAALEGKVTESERNLKAQWDSLLQQQETQVAAAVAKAELEKVERLAGNANLRLEEFGKALDALAASCTKEAIANGKNWIFANAANDTQKEVVLRYMLMRVKDTSATSEGRLHLLYLINDWSHHAKRKQQDSVLKLLERYAPQLYVFAHSLTPDASGKEKLEKLLALWRNHKYFSDEAYKQMDATESTVSTLRSAAMTEYSDLIQEIQSRVQATYQGFQQQHQDYARHVQQQIAQLKAQMAAAAAAASQPTKRRSRFDQKTPIEPASQPVTSASAPPQPPQGFGAPPPMPPVGFGGPPMPPISGPPPSWGTWAGSSGGPPPVPPFGPPPPGPWASGPPPMPPWSTASTGSGPPPFMPTTAQSSISTTAPSAPMDPNDPSLIPQLPYYELPAGLMLPLIKMEDNEYEPLKPSDLRLPVPMPPPERVLSALDAFYAPPSHENPRDAEGWERLGLHEYYKAKAKAVEEKAKRKKEKPKDKEEKKEQSGGSDGEQSSDSSRSSSPPQRRRSPSPPERRRKSRFESSEVPAKGESWRGQPEWSGEGDREGRRERREERREEHWEREDGREERREERGGGGGGGDRFPGLGSGADPFDQFRRARAGMYKERMQARELERRGGGAPD